LLRRWDTLRLAELEEDERVEALLDTAELDLLVRERCEAEFELVLLCLLSLFSATNLS
jgi:hypothetical protein